MVVHRLLRIAELNESIARELRAAAVELGYQPPQKVSPARGLPASGKNRDRAIDTLILLEEFGYISEGTVITPISRIFPSGLTGPASIARARIARHPSRPIWEHTGAQMNSLTELSKMLRDDFGFSFPGTSFNPNKYWRIEAEGPPERTLEAIAKQLAL